MSTTPNITVAQRLAAYSAQWRQPVIDLKADLRVATPAIIQKFDATKQTVAVKLAIMEKLLEKGKVVEQEAYLIEDVPIVLPSAGGFTLTMPIQQGDECLVVFADRCIDDWWQSGGVGKRLTSRLHDPADAIAIIGIWSQPNVLSNYSTSTPQLRSNDGQNYIEITSSNIHLAGSQAALIDNGIQSNGYATRTGISGSYTGHWFNFDYSASSLWSWIDDTNLGRVSILSDYRLKERIQPFHSGRALIDELKPVSFEFRNVPDDIFKSDNQRHIGLIAHEVAEVIPSAVNGEKDALTVKGTIQPQSLNLVDLLAVLIAAVQELSWKMGVVEEHLNL